MKNTVSISKKETPQTNGLASISTEMNHILKIHAFEITGPIQKLTTNHSGCRIFHYLLPEYYYISQEFDNNK